MIAPNAQIPVTSGTEQQLHDLLMARKEELQDNPDKVIRAIDEFSSENHLCNVGLFKGAHLVKELEAANPTVVVEFGTNTGYSSILMANLLKKLDNAKTSKVYSFEIDPKIYKIASDIVQLAGLSDRIVLIQASVAQGAESLQNNYNIEKVDFLFIDHYKQSYVPDLRIFESLGYIGPGTVLFADNVIFPGAPEYLEYIQSPPIVKNEHNRTKKNINGEKFVGKWGLLYETKTVNSQLSNGWPDGVEITKCVGVLN